MQNLKNVFQRVSAFLFAYRGQREMTHKLILSNRMTILSDLKRSGTGPLCSEAKV